MAAQECEKLFNLGNIFCQFVRSRSRRRVNLGLTLLVLNQIRRGWKYCSGGRKDYMFHLGVQWRSKLGGCTPDTGRNDEILVARDISRPPTCECKSAGDSNRASPSKFTLP